MAGEAEPGDLRAPRCLTLVCSPRWLHLSSSVKLSGLQEEGAASEISEPVFCLQLRTASPGAVITPTQVLLELLWETA